MSPSVVALGYCQTAQAVSEETVHLFKTALVVIHLWSRATRFIVKGSWRHKILVFHWTPQYLLCDELWTCLVFFLKDSGSLVAARQGKWVCLGVPGQLPFWMNVLNFVWALWWLKVFYGKETTIKNAVPCLHRIYCLMVGPFLVQKQLV